MASGPFQAAWISSGRARALMTSALVLLVSSSVVSCADPGEEVTMDAGIPAMDGGGADAGQPAADGGTDAGEPPTDAGEQGDAGPPSCADEGRVPPTGMTRDVDALSNIFNQDSEDPTRTWVDVFNEPFPDSGSVYLKTQRDQYISLQLTTTGVPTGTSGRLEINNPQGGFNYGVSLVTFSRCPGDFLDQDDPECKRRITNGGINWSVGVDGSNECELEPNTTYYLNILHTTLTQPPFTWHCDFDSADPARPEDCGDLVVAN